MGYSAEAEDVNVPKDNLAEFFDDIEGKLSMLVGLVPYEDFGLTLDEVRKPVLVLGDPGIGKTCGILSSIREMNKKLDMMAIKSATMAKGSELTDAEMKAAVEEAKEKHLGFKKILLGQTVVGSLSGIPVARPDGSVVRVQMPDLPNEERDGKYGVLFLDEITTADEMQIQPALGLADDSRSIGEYTLPEHWIVVAAGNGPQCTNFVRLDDMTISRFMVYDVAYDYKKDFRPFAHKTELNEDIIAFLNFDASACVRVESGEMDEAGKLFPCPRTWGRLSKELKMREVRGKRVTVDEMANFAGKIIGTKAGREFAAFLVYKKDMKYDVNKILEGTEEPPEAGMRKETYHIILQSLFRTLQNRVKKYNDVDEVPVAEYMAVGNVITWLLKFQELENKMNAIHELAVEIPIVSDMIIDDDFANECCPALNDFFAENSQILNGDLEGIFSIAQQQ